MINEYKELILETPEGDVKVLLNFADMEEVKDCKIIRFHKDGKILDVLRSDLLDIALQILDEVKEENVTSLANPLDKTYSTVIEHTWTTKRAYRKGERVTAEGKYDMSIPITNTVLQGNRDRKVEEYIYKIFIDGGIARDTEILKFDFNGVKFVMKKADFKTFIFMISDEADQRKLIPMEMTKVKKRIIKLSFNWIASRDYKKGEQITASAPYIVDTKQNAIFGDKFKLGYNK